MSSNSPSLLRPPFSVTPTMRITLFAWGIVMIGAYLLHSINSANTTALRDDVKKTQEGLAHLKTEHEAGSPELQSELDQARHELRILNERFNQLEPKLGQVDGFQERTSATQSELAVTKAKAAAVAAQAGSAGRDLGKIKQLQSDWGTLEASLTKGESGRRIVGSPKHLQLVVDIWQSERPSAETISHWESELNALTEPFTQVASDQATIAITDEHEKMLSDLGQQLKQQAAEFERQKLLLESVVRETSALQPAVLPLVDAIEQHRGQLEKAEVDRLAAVKETARAQAEKESADRIAASERERIDAVAKLKEQEIEAEKQRLADQAKQVEVDRKWAKLEAEMQRDMNEIKGLLLAYMAPGFTYRPDDTKGPVSYSLIKSSGGLQPTRTGLNYLFFMGCGNSDRPQGGLPDGVGGNIGSGTPIAPIERAQELLIKYGELMVRKGMLAP